MAPAVLHELLQCGLDDWVTLDDAAWIAAEVGPRPAPRDDTLSVLAEVFRAGFMVPGDLGHNGFEIWPGTPEDWIARAEFEMARLAWPPMGAGFWLSVTELGRSRAVD